MSLYLDDREELRLVSQRLTLEDTACYVCHILQGLCSPYGSKLGENHTVTVWQLVCFRDWPGSDMWKAVHVETIG